MALCFIALVLCGCVGFVTVGFQKLLCPQVQAASSSKYTRMGLVSQTLGIRGVLYNSTSAFSQSVDFVKLEQTPGQDITTLFQREASEFTSCTGINFRVAADPPCSTATPCPLGPLNSSSTLHALGLAQTSLLVGYDWSQVAQLQNYFVIDGAVLNMNPYMTLHPNPIPTDNVDDALRTILQTQDGSSGKDGTRLFYNRADIHSAVPCMIQRYYAGNIDKVTPGCFVSQLFLYTGLIVILGLVLVRFSMACVFNWFLSEKLAGPPDNLNRSAISPAVMPEGANISIDNKHGTAPWAGPEGGKRLAKPNNKSARSFQTASSTTLTNGEGPAPVMSLAQIGAELFAVCLVTCYSEGEESLRTTLDSISTTTYSDQRKLLFIVADGMITGAGEKKSTPDICVGLLEADPRFGNPMPMSYCAVGTGTKGENRAMVYAGHYSEC
jgi:chitin synthase